MRTGWLTLFALLALVLGAAGEAEAAQRGGGKKQKARQAGNQAVDAVAARSAKAARKGAAAGASGGARTKAEARESRVPLREVIRTPVWEKDGASSRLQEKLAAKEAIRYEVSGGVVGFDMELTIGAEGNVILRDHGEEMHQTRIGRNAYLKLAKSLKEAGIEDARAQYGDRDAEGRRILKTLVLSRAGKTKKISTYEDPLDLPPDGVRRQFELLDRFLQSPRLRSPRTPGQEFVTVHGYSIMLQLDRYVFHAPDKKDLASKPETLEATLTVVNAGARPIQLHFPSEKRYDFLLKDAGGNVRRRWSDGRIFSQVPQSATIGGENRLLFVGRLPLTDLDAGPLPPGNYHVEVELYTRGVGSSFADPGAADPGPTVNFATGTLQFRIDPPLPQKESGTSANPDSPRAGRKAGAGGQKGARQKAGGAKGGARGGAKGGKGQAGAGGGGKRKKARGGG
jgi:hypothetical protein